jgi:hypothetical protein
MLEKHLLHLKQMQQMQGEEYSIPPPIPSKRLTELPSEEQTSPQSDRTTFDHLNEPTLQFSYSAEYHPMVHSNPSNPDMAYPLHSVNQGSTGKRRSGSDTELEFMDANSVPRSSGGPVQPPGKRVRYNTPQW